MKAYFHNFTFIMMILSKSIYAIDIGFSAKDRIKFSDLPYQSCSIVSKQIKETNKNNNLNDYKNLDESNKRKLIDYNSYGDKGHLGSFCSATVISRNQFITAAHCLKNFNSENSYIRCPGGITFDIDRFTPHKEYDEKNHKNDIMIITTKKDIGIIPLKIPNSELEYQNIKENNNCGLFGYGKSGAARNDKSLAGISRDSNSFHSFSHKELREMLTFIEKNYSLEELSRENIISEFNDRTRDNFVIEENIVILRDFKNSRPGDSGGGLHCKDKNGLWYLMSLHSLGYSPKLPIFEVSKNILYFKDWINYHLNKNNSSLNVYVNTSEHQVNSFCRDAVKCQTILQEEGLALTSKIILIMNKIARQNEDLRKRGSQKDKSFLRALHRLKRSYREFIQECYEILRSHAYWQSISK